jgi:hypothetical protein
MIRKTIVRSLILIATIAAISIGLYFLVNSAWGQANLSGQGERRTASRTGAFARSAPPGGVEGGRDRGGDEAFSLQRGLPELGKTAGVLLAGAALIALFEQLVRPFKKKFQSTRAR